MAFNFGQHVMLSDKANYIDDIFGVSVIESSEPKKVIYEILPKQNSDIANGTFYFKCNIHPFYETALNVVIKLQQADGTQVTLKTQRIEKAFNYLSTLQEIKSEMTALAAQEEILQAEYESATKDVVEKRQLKISAEQAWINAGSPASGQIYIDYYNAGIALDKAIIAKEKVEQQLSEIKAKENEMATFYQNALNTISISIETSFNLITVEYAKVIVEIISESAAIADSLISDSPDWTFYKIKEILGSGNIIPHANLKRIAVQGATNTIFFVNNNELRIGSNNLLEIANPHFTISSFKIIPDKKFFIIDYEY